MKIDRHNSNFVSRNFFDGYFNPKKNNIVIHFLEWLQSRLIYAWLELVLKHTEKLCIVSKYRQIYTNIRIKIIKLITALLARTFGYSTKIRINLIFFLNFTLNYSRIVKNCRIGSMRDMFWYKRIPTGKCLFDLREELR